MRGGGGGAHEAYKSWVVRLLLGLQNKQGGHVSHLSITCFPPAIMCVLQQANCVAFLHSRLTNSFSFINIAWGFHLKLNLSLLVHNMACASQSKNQPRASQSYNQPRLVLDKSALSQVTYHVSLRAITD